MKTIVKTNDFKGEHQSYESLKRFLEMHDKEIDILDGKIFCPQCKEYWPVRRTKVRNEIRKGKQMDTR